MEQLHFITKLLDIKDPNIQILDIINKDTHKEIIAKLDYDAPSCPECGNQLKKYDFQKQIAQKLIEKNSMTDIAHQLSISTSTVIRKLNDSHFEHDFSRLPEIMSWDVETVRGVTVSIGR
ncbi:degenerate transposase [Streptococcus pneumoniae]|nr:degenerate transposase [Streptococcus pneumoniae]